MVEDQITMMVLLGLLFFQSHREDSLLVLPVTKGKIDGTRNPLPAQGEEEAPVVGVTEGAPPQLAGRYNIDI